MNAHGRNAPLLFAWPPDFSNERNAILSKSVFQDIVMEIWCES